MRRLRLLLLTAWVLCVPERYARAEDSLRHCIARAELETRGAGARPLGRMRRGFLLTRDTTQHAFDLPAAGCAGFLAVARRHGQDLQLQVYDAQGVRLGHDTTVDAHPYVQVCVGQAVKVFVSVTMTDGDGEYLLSSLWDAPPLLPGLDEAMAECVHAGLPRPAPAEVGPPLLGEGMGQGLARLRTRLSDAGYDRAGPMLGGILPAGGREVRRVRLQQGSCYALAVVGDVTVGDIDLRVFSPGARPRLLAADTTRRREAIAKLCAEEDGEHLLEVRMYDGGGGYAVETMALQVPAGPQPPGMNPRVQLGYAEASAELARRGLLVEGHVWNLVPPRDAQPTPVPVQAGHCYAFGAVADPDAGIAELSLTDADGNLIASDMGLFAPPIVFHCPAQSGTLIALSRMREARRAEPVLLLRAGDAPVPELAWE